MNIYAVDFAQQAAWRQEAMAVKPSLQTRRLSRSLRDADPPCRHPNARGRQAWASAAASAGWAAAGKDAASAPT